MAQKNLVAASLQAKKGRLYAVIQRKCPDGKFKSVWRALGLVEDAPKSKVNKAFREVVANTVIHYHATLRKAFQQALKEELLALLKLTKDDPIYPAIMLAGGLGLRRSEALGVRWSRINFEERYVLLDTKIVESKDEGGKFIRTVEEMKIFGDTGSLIAS